MGIPLHVTEPMVGGPAPCGCGMPEAGVLSMLGKPMQTHYLTPGDRRWRTLNYSIGTHRSPIMRTPGWVCVEIRGERPTVVSFQIGQDD